MSIPSVGELLARAVEEHKALAERLELAGAAIDRVRELHESDGAESPFCNHCGFGWPCPTIRALHGDEPCDVCTEPRPSFAYEAHKAHGFPASPSGAAPQTPAPDGGETP